MTEIEFVVPMEAGDLEEVLAGASQKLKCPISYDIKRSKKNYDFTKPGKPETAGYEIKGQFFLRGRYMEGGRLIAKFEGVEYSHPKFIKGLRFTGQSVGEGELLFRNDFSEYISSGRNFRPVLFE